jgi:hypothetical protein
VYGALTLTRLLVRKYEFRDEEERGQLEQVGWCQGVGFQPPRGGGLPLAAWAAHCHDSFCPLWWQPCVTMM